MQKTKILAVMLVAVTLSLITTTETQAAWKGWTEYFTQDEGRAIKKMVDSYIRDSIENNDKRWKDIISGANIKDGEIDSDKVDSTIAKRKVYTGSITCSDSGYDKKIGTGVSAVYWKRIAVPEINMNSMPQITIYNKVNTDADWGNNQWEFIDTDSVKFTDGSVYMLYGFNDPIECPNNDGSVGIEGYKISVGY